MDIAIKQAVAAHKEGKSEEAEHLYLKILKTDPKHSDANHNLGILNISKNKPVEALLMFKIAIDVSPHVEQYWISYINTLIDQNQFKEAKRNSEKAIILNPSFSVIHYNLGIILHKLNNLDDSEKSFKKAIELEPNYVSAYYNLGITQYELNKLTESEKNFKKTIELKPEYPEALYNLGRVQHELIKLDESEKNFKKTIELKPEYPEALYNLGRVQQDLTKLDEAVANYKKAIDIKPGYKTAHLGRGKVLMQKGEFGLALKDLDLINNEESRAHALACLYNLGRKDDIYKRIESYSGLDSKNLRVAAFSSFISKIEKKNTAHKFCNNPMNFIYSSNLSGYFKNSNIFFDEVIDELKNIETVWEDKTTHNGFHSINKFNILETPPKRLNNLKSIIQDEINSYYSRFKNENCLYIKEWPSKNNLSGWYIILKKQGYQDPHIHPGGWLSGVVYLKVVPDLEKNEGAIEFSLNGQGYFDQNSSSVIHQPKVGDIILFPSSLHHKTIPFTTNTDRIVISFDLMPL